ncbi:hypothetical protein BDW74DRAFT_184260 [Aspergillus multicolor]|uniref:uncharacterized protein n=1 Tax=Aspergillus multicolor TaxID=41759 RepID=UPI003CCD138A
MAFFTSPNRPVPPLEVRCLHKPTDHVQGVLSVEEYLDRVDPYTTSTLKWPRPFDTTPASPEISQQVDNHRRDILSILDVHNLPSRGYLRFTVHSVTKRGYPSPKPRTVLSLTYMTDPFLRRSPQPPSKSKMDAARDQIAALLKTKGVLDIDTEIIFINQAFNPLFFDVSDEDPLFSTCKYTIRPAVCNHILPRYTNAWQKVGLTYLGLTVEDNLKYPTLLIPVSPGSKANWAALDHDIKSMLKGKNIQDLNVEFWPGPLKENWSHDAEVVDEFDTSYYRVKTQECKRAREARRRPNLDKIDGPAANRQVQRVDDVEKIDEEEEEGSSLDGFFIIPLPGISERCRTPKPLLEHVLANYRSRIFG